MLRRTDGVLSNITVKDALTSFDGLSRQVRLRYDTPLWSGFCLRTSYGRNLLSDSPSVRNQDLYDIAVPYETQGDDVRFLAQTAYSRKGGDTTIFDGSGSLLHVPTGLSDTAAAGRQDQAGVRKSYGQIKFGSQGDLVAWGRTAVALDWYRGTGIETAGSDSTSYALSVVQNIPRWNTGLWLTWRAYDYSEPRTEFDSASALFVGGVGSNSDRGGGARVGTRPATGGMLKRCRSPLAA